MSENNLFPDLNSKNDFSSTDVFPGFINADAGIDLRKEMRNIIHGTGGISQKGHWIIFRRYDLTKKSKFFNEVTSEGVGGPQHPFSDELILTRHITVESPTPGEFEAAPGIIRAPGRMYFFEYTVKPRPDDVILEIDVDNHTIKPDLAKLKEPFVERFNIKLVDPHRGDNGRIEFYKVHAVRDAITWAG